MKSIFILIISCSTFLSINLDKTILEDFNKCSAELSVEKNRNSKSAFDENGVTFLLNLINTSTNSNTYFLTTEKIKGLCGNNTNKRSSTKNIDLEVTFLMKNSNKAKVNTDSFDYEIKLQPGESFKFEVNLKVPKNTPFFNWGCIEIIAQSKDCSTESAKTILSVYVPDPNDR